MTEDRANMTAHTQGAFDAFVGFVYATTISLVIKTAYDTSCFETVSPVVLTLVLLCFFSQDWMVRVIGRLRMSEAMTKSPTLFIVIVKVLLEITIVYFLLLASLQFVEIYSGKETWTAGQRSRLSYTTAAFAIFCGLWNMVMINISPEVNWQQIWSLFKGHLDNKIVKQFPKITDWHKELRTQKNIIEAFLNTNRQQAKEAKSSNSSYEQIILNITRWLYYALEWCLFFMSVMKNSLHLFLPYLLVLHIAILNLVLGVSIVLSTWILDGKSLLEGLPFHVPLWALLSAGGFFLLCAYFFLGIHFRSAQEESLSERRGCASLAIFILLFYSAFPVIYLVGLIVCQQVVANFFMTKFFKPSSASPSASAEQTGWVCPFLRNEGVGPHESEVDEGEGQP